MKHFYSEKILVAGCRKGDSHLQRALYHQYHRKMYGLCLRYASNADDAQDMLQEGFIKVYKNIHTFKEKGSLEGWIRRIILNTALEFMRKKGRFYGVDLDQASNLQTETNFLSDLSCEEILSLIQALPAGYRTIFNLYVIEGYTHAEIGKKLGISTGTSKSQLSRAKAMLKQRYEKLSTHCYKTCADL